MSIYVPWHIEYKLYYISIIFRHGEEAGNAAYIILHEKYFTDCVRSQLEERSFQPSMMLSEWMQEVPEDFKEHWIMVACPLGKRSRLIASKVEI
jgi:hypothetical protein